MIELDPIDLEEHRDFGREEVSALLLWLDRTFAERPPARTDAILFDQGGEPMRMTRDELAAHLRATGLYSLARRLERCRPDRGEMPALIVGDEGPRLHVVDVTAFVEPPATHAPAVLCLAQSSRPRRRSSAGEVYACGMLGRLAGGAS